MHFPAILNDRFFVFARNKFDIQGPTFNTPTPTDKGMVFGITWGFGDEEHSMYLNVESEYYLNPQSNRVEKYLETLFDSEQFKKHTIIDNQIDVSTSLVDGLHFCIAVNGDQIPVKLPIA